VYAHNSINLVQVGQKVKAGQHICNMGNTGFVISGATPYWKVNPYAGTHLHIGVRKVKRPRRGGWSYEGSDIKIDVVNYDNGFKGSIDPRPILASIPRETVTDPRIPLMQQVIALQKKLLELLRKR
jgi:murein DD-endopeptidase MepM/ murein hydrolase activator NlpD